MNTSVTRSLRRNIRQRGTKREWWVHTLFIQVRWWQWEYPFHNIQCQVNGSPTETLLSVGAVFFPPVAFTVGPF